MINFEQKYDELNNIIVKKEEIQAKLQKDVNFIR